jgi:Xaa-Pro aminopeptidase
MDLNAIQAALTAGGLDGWLFYDFRGSDPIGRAVLGLPEDLVLTRRWFYLVPARGEPRKLCHRIEEGALDALPGGRTLYLSWRELEAELGRLLSGMRRVAMQYSPGNAVPTISRVDAGTIEQVRSVGVEPVSSGDLVQAFEATWSDAQYASHVRTARVMRRLVDVGFAEAARRAGEGDPATEMEIRTRLREGMAEAGVVATRGPIVAVNEHSGDPHHELTEENAAPIRAGDFLLIDIWGREDTPDGVCADITWTGVLATEATARQREIFEIVRDARDAGIAAVRKAFANGREIRGYEVDVVVRDVIERAGHGDRFIHRTGHSIGREGHGNGTNMDDLESRDDRLVLPRTCFSIEPGIYLDDFGVRSEVDVWIAPDGGVEVTGGVPQTALILARSARGVVRPRGSRRGPRQNSSRGRSNPG